MAQYCVLIVAYLIPAVAIAYTLTGNPIPHIAIGEVAPRLNELQTDLGLDSYTGPFSNLSMLNVACITLVLMAGTAGLPHVIVRFYTVETVESARWSAVWALLFIGILYTVVPAVAMFARLEILQSFTQMGAGGMTELGWIQNWAQTGLIETSGWGATPRSSGSSAPSTAMSLCLPLRSSPTSRTGSSGWWPPAASRPIVDLLHRLHVMGCLGGYSFRTHLITAIGLIVGVCAFAVIRNWDTFELMYANMTAMSEGREIAERMRRPEDLVEYIAARPEQASLVTYELGAREEGIFFRPTVKRPIVKTHHLLLQAEYARQVEAGQLVRETTVSLDSLSVFALPGAGLDNHRNALASWRAQNVLRPDSSVSLREVVIAITEFGDEAAADWFMTSLGRPQVWSLPERWGLRNSDPPLPSSGIHLSWSHLPSEATPSSHAAHHYRSLSRTAYTDRVYRLVQTLRRNPSFRRRERSRLRKTGSGLSVQEQRELVQGTYPEGTAADYADFMAQIVNGTHLSNRGTQFLRRQIEIPIGGDSVDVPVQAVGTHAGAFPGVISLVGYIRFDPDRAPRVFALFLEGLPIAVFYHLVQTGLDKGFLLRLLSDTDFFERVRARLSAKREIP